MDPSPPGSTSPKLQLPSDSPTLSESSDKLNSELEPRLEREHDDEDDDGAVRDNRPHRHSMRRAGSAQSTNPPNSSGFMPAHNSHGNHSGRRRSMSNASSNSVAVAFPSPSMGPNAISGAPESVGTATRRNMAFSFSSRRRGFSRSSHATTGSGALSISSRRSRSSQAIDDADSDASIGETDEDVCFPAFTEEEMTDSQGVNITELDQLLNLTDSEENSIHAPSIHDARSTTARRPRRSTEVQSPSAPGSSEDTISADKELDLQINSPSQLKIPFVPHRPNDRRNNKMDDLRLPDAVTIDDRRSLRSARSARSIAMDERFSFFASNVDSTIHASDLASLVGDGESFGKLFEPANGVWWLDCYNPSGPEMKVLSRAFGIHPLTTEDIRMEESREKFEMFKKYYFVSFHTFIRSSDKEEDLADPVNFYMVVFADGVLSFHFTPVVHTRNVRRRMRQLRDYVTVTSDWICYALIDDIVDSFAPVITEIEEEADYIEDNVYVPNPHASENTSTILTRLSEARKKTMRVTRLLTGKADVIRGLAKRCKEQWENTPRAEIALYMGDIQDHIVTMHQNLTAYEKIFSRTHVNYMAQLQVEFVNASNHMTAVLGKATLIGTVLVPMNLITGMFGMNVKVPGQDGSNLGWFFGILGSIVMLIVGLALVGNMWIQRVQNRV